MNKALLQQALDALLIYQERIESDRGTGRSNEEIDADGDTDPVITDLRAAIVKSDDGTASKLSDNPKDLNVEVILKQMGGFAPISRSGIRITHIPTGKVFESDTERSQHANREVALQKLRAAIAQPESEQHAFEEWLSQTMPFGDAASVQHQWTHSSEYVDFHKAPTPAQPAAYAPLTAETVFKIARQFKHIATLVPHVEAGEFAKAIERAVHGEPGPMACEPAKVAFYPGELEELNKKGAIAWAGYDAKDDMR